MSVARNERGVSPFVSPHQLTAPAGILPHMATRPTLTFGIMLALTIAAGLALRARYRPMQPPPATPAQEPFDYTPRHPPLTRVYQLDTQSRQAVEASTAGKLPYMHSLLSHAHFEPGRNQPSAPTYKHFAGVLFVRACGFEHRRLRWRLDWIRDFDPATSFSTWKPPIPPAW